MHTHVFHSSCPINGIIFIKYLIYCVLKTLEGLLYAWKKTFPGRVSGI